MRNPKRILIILLAAALFTLPVWAQGNPTGKITGKVQSSDGQPLPGVVVTLRSPNLPGVRTVTTATSGEFLVAALPPGPYTLTFELAGFRTTEQRLDVPAAQSIQTSVQLALSDVEEVIYVTGTATENVSQNATSATTFL